MNTPSSSPSSGRHASAARAVAAAWFSELLKHRRTAVVWAPLSVTIVIVVLTAALSVQPALRSDPDLAGAGTPQQLMLALLTPLWLTLWLPVASAFTAGLSADLEQRTSSWRVLHARATPPALLYLARLTFLWSVLLASSVLMVGLGGAGSFVAHGDLERIPWPELTATATVGALLSFALVTLHAWIATWRGLGVSLLVAFVGVLAAQAAGPVWPLLPWAWTPRLLASGAESGVLLAWSACGVWCALVLAASLVWYGRREPS